MDRYDRIISDIQRRTADETIHWKSVNANRYSESILNPVRVLRTFEANYPVAKKVYVLLFLEMRVDVLDDLAGALEIYGYKLLILDQEAQIVLDLYEGVVDRDDLLKLSGLIDEHNDRAKDFFEAFEESGVA